MSNMKKSLSSSHMSALSQARRQKQPCSEMDSVPPAVVSQDQLQLCICELLPSAPVSPTNVILCEFNLPLTCKSRGTGLQLNAPPKTCPSNRVICPPPAPKTRKRRRTRAEMTAAVPLSTPITSVSHIPKTRRPKRTRAEMAATSTNSGHPSVSNMSVCGTQSNLSERNPQVSFDCTTPSLKKMMVRKRRRTRAEMTAAELVNVTTSSPQLITYRRRRKQNEITIDVLPITSAADHSVSVRQFEACAQSGLGTTPNHHLPLSHTVRSSTLPKSRRTCFELDTSRYTSPSSMSRAVLNAVGMCSIPTKPLLLPPSTTCALCGAAKFAFECPSLCCGNGVTYQSIYYFTINHSSSGRSTYA